MCIREQQYSYGSVTPTHIIFAAYGTYLVTRWPPRL